MRKLLNHPLLLKQDENKTAQEFKHLLSEKLDISPEFSTKFIFLTKICEKIKTNNIGKTNSMEREKIIIVSYWT